MSYSVPWIQAYANKINRLCMIPLLTNALRYDSQPALISDGRTYTYADLIRDSGIVAQHLLKESSDLQEACVAYLIEPSYAYTSTQWGIWKAGGIAVPLCTLHPKPSLKYVLEDTGAKLVITSKQNQEVIAELTSELGIEMILYEDIKEGPKRILPDVAINRKAMILYTSGTTSKPKGVVTTHAIIDFQIRTLVEAWQWKSTDSILNVLPLHHVHGIINVMSCALYVGASCTFLPKFNSEKVWNIFCSGNINLFMAVPTIYYKLIHAWNESENMKIERSQALTKFRFMVSGSAALPIATLETWKEISGHVLLERYGMTEIGMALSNPYDGERRAGHVGHPLPGVDIRLWNESGLVAEEGVSGEIQVKGENVFLEYWNKKEATEKSFTEDGWFITGDIAMLHEGYYKILGRDSVDIIKSGGYKISAIEIENVLRDHPEIMNCAVVGLPDEEWGEVVAASLIVARGTIDFKEVQLWLRDKIPGYKIPRKFIIQDALPRNTLGKVTKNELKKHFKSM